MYTLRIAVLTALFALSISACGMDVQVEPSPATNAGQTQAPAINNQPPANTTEQPAAAGTAGSCSEAGDREILTGMLQQFGKTDLNIEDVATFGRAANGEQCIIEINLENEDLTGTLPPQIGELNALQTLKLRDNALRGPIPAELTQLAELRVLSLSDNDLDGVIPPDFGNLTQLQTLALGGNNLTGPIPSEIGNLTSLSELFLDRNQLSGPIPPEIGNLTNITVLFLHQNQLTGAVPAELGKLTAMRQLSLDGNQLQGPLPLEFRNLTELSGASFNLRNDEGICVPAELQDAPWYTSTLPTCDA
jgi:hypothetical protein